MSYRTLKTEEVTILQNQGCHAESWADISVKDDFITNNIVNTRFGGKIKLGILSGKIEVENGVIKPCGIYDSNITNCDIADNVYISEVKNIANYIIEEDVAIENVGSLLVNKESNFGNGTEIEVFNEGGGRELPIFDKLSAQIAYLTVTYRHDKELIDSLLGLIKDYSESKKSDRGHIETGVRIHNSLIIRNVNVDKYATIAGASLLDEGTIKSCKEAPTTIGEGVVAKKFIVLSGSTVDGCAMIDKSFVGQGVKIGKQYSAENSTFFANCEGFHGEACSMFAGPYTVTHHKSTLLIAGLFSFYNAGSGTNQSNHMYKLGPLHQGILERGSKTGSFCYLLWPCRVGAFTAVVGKHYANFDTSDFPFSYITEEKGKSILTPAMNLFTVGTRRDSEKWPGRDRRKDPEKLDLIHFDLFSPFIMGKIVNGINILNELNEKANPNNDSVNYKGIHILRLLLKTTRKYYEMALKVYMGQEIVKRLEDIDQKTSLHQIRQKLTPQTNEGEGKWVDIAGLFAPQSKIEELLNSIKSGSIKTIDDLNKQLRAIYENYDKYAWTWCMNLIGEQTGAKPDSMAPEQLIQIIIDWKSNAVKLNHMIMKDAEKEFDSNSKIGFGIDGNNETKDLDFKAVRGTFNDNKFVLGLQKESEEIERKADRLISLIEKTF